MNTQEAREYIDAAETPLDRDRRKSEVFAFLYGGPVPGVAMKGTKTHLDIQSEGRVHRLGQADMVTPEMQIIDLKTTDTSDEEVLARIQEKMIPKDFPRIPEDDNGH